MTISLIIPCYNEEQALQKFYEELSKVCSSLSNYDFEFLFVDDGSKDKTLEIIKNYAENDERVKYISFSKNFGKESAMYAGFCNSVGDYVAVMDADMQDPPSLLPEMIKILEDGEYDSVATRRVSRVGEPRLRSFFARMFYKIIRKISDSDIVDGARDFRLMKREMVDSIVSMCEYNRFSKGIFGWIGFKTYWLPYENVERVAGETKWSFFKLFKYSIDGIVNFSNFPLHIATFLGGLSVFSSFAILIATLIYSILTSSAFLGVPFITAMILLIGGIQLITIGIMGQYLSKIHMETKKRPHYIVAKTNKKDIVRK